MQEQSNHSRVRSSVCRHSCAIVFFCVAMAIAAQAQFTKLVDLTPTTGEFPASPLVQGLDGNLYGTTSNSGAFGGGTFFQLTPGGTLTVLYNFCVDDNTNCPDGAEPAGSIALGADGSFYGTTKGSFTGGENSTIYNITSAGSLTTLHTFCGALSCSGAFASSGGLTLAWNGNFYGTSFPPDGSSAYDNLVYSMTPTGTVHTRLMVCPNQLCPTNAGPSGTLLQAGGGYLIGPGPGGANGFGAVYRMTPLGTPSILYSMCDDNACDGGTDTNTPLVQNAAGNLFGTNLAGGGGAHCIVGEGCGTAFQLIGTAFTVLHHFCNWPNCTDGGRPTALIQASDGNFYGTTNSFGAHQGGVVFKVTNTHQYTVVHAFATADGTAPQAALMQATDGTLYGTTVQGGSNPFGNEQGTIFKVSLGLPPFVKTVQPAGKAGDTILILGNGLTGSTSVTFNGTSASFSVVSDTEISATIPAGATTGTMQVVTPSTTLSTIVPFPVHQ
jgi:uncharacterized repeat protein (TIGR03803 family)